MTSLKGGGVQISKCCYPNTINTITVRYITARLFVLYMSMERNITRILIAQSSYVYRLEAKGGFFTVSVHEMGPKPPRSEQIGPAEYIE